MGGQLGVCASWELPSHEYTGRTKAKGADKINSVKMIVQITEETGM